MPALRSDLAEAHGEPVEEYPSLLYQFEKGLKTNPDGAAVIVMHTHREHLAQLAESGRADSVTSRFDATTNGGGGETNGAAQTAKDKEANDCLIWTHRQIHRAAVEVSLGLLAQGVEAESTVVTLVPMGIEWAIMLLATAIMRVSIAPLDEGALTQPRADELRSLMGTLKPSVIVVSGTPGATEAADEALSKAGVNSIAKVSMDNSTASKNGWQSFATMAAQADRSPVTESAMLQRARQPDPDRIVTTLFTSGTSSGNPKGCPHRVSGLAYSVNRITYRPKGRTENLRTVLAGANFRAVPAFLVQWSLVHGAGVVMSGANWAPHETLEAVERFRVTQMFNLPVMVHTLRAHPDFEKRDLRSLKSVILGGDLISKDLLLKAAKSYPSATVSNGHGMTETVGTLHWAWADTPVERLPYFGEICPIGKVSPGSKVRVYDNDEGRVAKRNQPGELHISSKGTLRHYLNHAHDDCFYEDEHGRWFKTGDLAFLDDDDAVYIVGRANDRTKRGGIPIMPVALETCINKFTGSQTSVIAKSHSTLGHEPFAIGRSLGGKTKEQIEQHVLQKFGGDYALGGVMTLQQLGLEDFPVNPSGKIMKTVLQANVAAHLKPKS